ncbi:MAG: hypothetical protein QOE81_285 [Verrucomicrobiota bacterium]
MTFSRKPEEFWETFFERTAHFSGIPNEMTNSKGSEIFSGVPGGKAGHSSVTFILPNSFPDSKRVDIGNTNCFRCPSRPGGCNKKQANRSDAASVMLG